jgi:hypothetical protein
MNPVYTAITHFIKANFNIIPTERRGRVAQEVVGSNLGSDITSVRFLLFSSDANAGVVS